MWFEGSHPDFPCTVQINGMMLEHDVIAILRPACGQHVSLHFRDHLLATQPVTGTDENRITSDTVLVRHLVAIWRPDAIGSAVALQTDTGAGATAQLHHPNIIARGR